MPILILGSSGNIGNVLTEALIEKSDKDIIRIDRIIPNSQISSKCETHQIDFVQDGFPQSLRDRISKSREEVVAINLIAKDYPIKRSIERSNLSSSPFGLSVEEVTESYRLTLGSSYRLIKDMHELKPKSYHVILTGSIYAFNPPNHSVYNDEGSQNMVFKPISYSLAKSAQHMLLREACKILGSKKARFNMLSFGGIDLQQDESFKARYCSVTPNQSMVTIEEVCSSYLNLIFESPVSMNGSNILVDGGWCCAN